MYPDGKRLLKEPLPFLDTSTKGKGRARQEALVGSLDALAKFVVTELNYFVREHGEDVYDYKTSFKSQTDVQSIRNAVLKAFEKDVTVRRAKPFVLPK